jgi:hypothetical protein
MKRRKKSQSVICEVNILGRLSVLKEVGEQCLEARERFNLYQVSCFCYGPAVGSASKRNEYQEYFLGRGEGGKGGRCMGLTTLPPSCADCLKSGSVNLLELLTVCRGL